MAGAVTAALGLFSFPEATPGWAIRSDGSSVLDRILAVAPTVVILDQAGATVHDTIVTIKGPGSIFLDASTTTWGAGDFGNVKVEWDFGDPGSTGNTIRGFKAGHFYNHEPAENTDYTITCTVTNLDGASASKTLTARVTPNDRTPASSLGVAAADATDYQLDPATPITISAAWAGDGTTNDLIVRSSTPGTPVNIRSGAAVDLFSLAGSARVTFIDINFIDGATAPTSLIKCLTCSSVTLVRVTFTSAVSNQAINTTSTTGLIVQDVDGATTAGAQSFWPGSATCITLLDSSFSHSGTERPYRSGAVGFTIDNSSFTYSNATQGKNAAAFVGVTYLWCSRTSFSCVGTTGQVLTVGHTAGADATNYSVFERCIFYGTGSGSGVWLSPNTTTVDGCVFRNCIFDRTKVTVTNTTNDLRIYSPTVYGVAAAHQFLYNATAGNMIGLRLEAMLFVNAALTYASTSTTGVVRTASADGGATEIAAINGNISPVPVSVADGVKDVRIQSTYYAWADVNGWASSTVDNKQYAATLDARYLPAVADWSNIAVTMPADMAQFQEDYYGNARGATWYAGAVDINSDISAPTATLDSTDFLTEADVDVQITYTDAESGVSGASLGVLNDTPGIGFKDPLGNYYGLTQKTGVVTDGSPKTVAYTCTITTEQKIPGIWQLIVHSDIGDGTVPTNGAGVPMAEGTQIGSDFVVSTGRVNPRLDRLRRKFQFPRSRSF